MNESMIEREFLKFLGVSQYEESKELNYIKQVFMQHQLFYYLHCDEILEHVRIYINDTANTKKNKIRKYYDAAFHAYANCYNALCREQLRRKQHGEANSYTLLLLKYKLNQFSQLIEGENICHYEHTVEEVKLFLEKYPDHIYAHDLLAKFYMLDSIHWRDVSGLYKKAISISGQNDLYYELGKFYEKCLNRKKQAYQCYVKCDDYNSLYRAIKVMRTDCVDNWNNVINYANKIIRLTLNGYELKCVEPDKLIYAYMTYMCLGDTYRETGYYDLTVKCYKKALEIANVWNDIDGWDELFVDVFKCCTPEEIVKLKLDSMCVG